MQQSVLGTGLSGLVGSKLVELLSDQYKFENLDLSRGVDILNESQVREYVNKSDAQVLIHMAAFTDVTKAYEETGNTDGVTYKVNVIGTRNVVKAVNEAGKYLIHLSTAYVFDGQKEVPYVETDACNPIEWYGQTKLWAEEEVMNAGGKYSILRIDRPYRLDDFPKKDILHKVMEKLQTNTLPPQFTDTSWTPTSIEVFCDWMRQIMNKQPQGIYHATTEPVFSDYTFALWVKDKYQLPGEVKQGSLAGYLKSSNRPYQKNTALDTTKLISILQ